MTTSIGRDDLVRFLEAPAIRPGSWRSPVRTPAKARPKPARHAAPIAFAAAPAHLFPELKSDREPSGIAGYRVGTYVDVADRRGARADRRP